MDIFSFYCNNNYASWFLKLSVQNNRSYLCPVYSHKIKRANIWCYVFLVVVFNMVETIDSKWSRAIFFVSRRQRSFTLFTFYALSGERGSSMLLSSSSFLYSYKVCDKEKKTEKKDDVVGDEAEAKKPSSYFL